MIRRIGLTWRLRRETRVTGGDALPWRQCWHLAGVIVRARKGLDG